MSYSVAQNTTFLTTASVLQKVISFVYFTIVARLIGVGNTGDYFFALSFTTIFTVVADLGLGPVLTRETARRPEETERNVQTLLTAKLLLGAVAYGLAVALVHALDYSETIKTLVYLSGLTMFFDNVQTVFYSVFRARKNLVVESAGIVSSQFITLVVGTVALYSGLPLYWLILAYTIPSFFNACYSGYMAHRIYGLTYRLAFDKTILKMFVLAAVPFAIAGLMARLYAYADSIIMSKMLTSEHLGWWSVPYKISFAFQFIPSALAASVYPVASALYVSDRARISELFTKSIQYLCLIVFPLSLGLMAVAEPVVMKVYGSEYAPSIPVLRLLLVSLIFGFFSFVTGAVLNATNRQSTQTTLLATALLISTAINLIFIPRFGIIAAGVAAILGNIVLALGGYWFASRTIPMSHSGLIIQAVRVFWPAAVMGILAYWLVQRMSFVIVIPIAALVYGALLILTGVVTEGMVNEFLVKMKIKKDVVITN